MKVAIIMGSKSDYEVMKEAVSIMEIFNISYTCEIVSAHRTPDKLFNFSKGALNSGYDVIIAGAGGAAHLPGMVASMTVLPVIGVPVKTSILNGVDSLLSIVQMPGGIPVATVAINQAKNAGLLAVSILALKNPELSLKLQEYRKKMTDAVLGDRLC